MLFRSVEQQDTSGIKKAKTAVFFGIPRGLIGKLSQPGGAASGSIAVPILQFAVEAFSKLGLGSLLSLL